MSTQNVVKREGKRKGWRGRDRRRKGGEREGGKEESILYVYDSIDLKSC